MPLSRIDALFGVALSFAQRDTRSDHDLLSRFMDHRDESAFQALLTRHTPGVRAACRGWLRSENDIDDAAQVTFLILIQRARSIRDRSALGHWLYRVADNVARRLKKQVARSKPMPTDLPEPSRPEVDDLLDVLNEEIARLPEKYRLPVQLCYVAGLSTAEAAQRLGWPKGTLLTRLAWARERLQRNLRRRGLAPAGIALVTTAQMSRASARWLRTTTQAALRVREGSALIDAGLSERNCSLGKGVLNAMFRERIASVAVVVLLAVGLVGFALKPWAAASDTSANGRREAGPPSNRERAADEKREASAVPDGEKPPVSRRREATIRLPVGTFVKEVEAAEYGSGRISWTYEDDRVLGKIEANVLGVEVELATEAEYSLSSNGTIYGILNTVRLTHLRLPDKEEFAAVKPFIGLWTVVEPFVNDLTTDVPFSYQFRTQGDRLVLSNFHMLLAGPGISKLSALGLANQTSGADSEALGILLYFQGLAAAIEGTYTTPDSKDRVNLAPQSLPMKIRGKDSGKPRK